MTIILGTLNFDYPYVSEQFTSEKIDLILKRATNLGITKLDTAFYYNKTEALLGQSNYLDQFKIASKANPWFENDFSNGKFGQLSKRGIEQQLTMSLKNLGVETIDSYFLHCWDYETPIEETLHAFDEQYRKGRFNSFGVSNISPSQFKTIIDVCEKENLNIQPNVYQGMYNMYCRRIEELFPTFVDYRIHFECYNPLAGGLLTGKWAKSMPQKGRFNDNPIYQSIFWNEIVVKETAFLTADIALRWLRNHSGLRESDSVIIGCSNEDQLIKNVASLRHKIKILSNDTLQQIEHFYQQTKSFQPNYFY